MGSVLEFYNLINYLKIVDLSLLNLLDYVEINESKALTLDNDRLVLNLNAPTRRLLEGFIVNNINNETYYGKHNILVNTCKPANNWRNPGRRSDASRIMANDSSVCIDMIRLNSLADSVFRKLPSMAESFSAERRLANGAKAPLSIQKDLKIVEFTELDLADSYVIMGKILAAFGFVNRDGVNYNIIRDGNGEYFHDVGELDEGLYGKVRLELMKKGII